LQTPGDPEVLYHYTTPPGVIGIVQNKMLWATDAEFLNDAQELRFGRAELREALIARADELIPPGLDEETRPLGDDRDYSRAWVMRSAADHLDPGPGRPYAEKQYHWAYVACFCEDGDLLSQWRAYGLQAGYAVGFRTAVLRDMRPVKSQAAIESGAYPEIDEEPGVVPPPVRLVRVRYGAYAIRRAVADVLSAVAPEPVGHPGVMGFYRAQTLVIPTLAGIKHGAFSEEREWRLIVVSSIGEAVAFRSGRLGVIPYVTLPFPSRAIAEIVVGPGPEQALRERGAVRLVAEHGFTDVTIRRSTAPFRG
jgi:hypothetical protein